MLLHFLYYIKSSVIKINCQQGNNSTKLLEASLFS